MQEPTKEQIRDLLEGIKGQNIDLADKLSALESRVEYVSQMLGAICQTGQSLSI